MNAEAIPTIRLEIEHMKHSIMSAIGLRNNDLSDAVNQQIENAFAAYDFEGNVRRIAHECITDCITDLFRDKGKGRLVVREAVQKAFDKVFKDVKSP